MARRNQRIDHGIGHRTAYEKARKKIFATQTVCGICGRAVDFSVKYPHPLSPTVDHIIPVSKGGHPSDIDNLQLAHFMCNRWKYDRINLKRAEEEQQPVSNNDLPWSTNWLEYRSNGGE